MELDPAHIAKFRWDLTPQQWDQLQNVIRDLQHPISMDAESERRDIERARFVFPIKLTWTDPRLGEGELWAMSHNLSRRGMGLIAKRMFHTNDRLTLHLPMPDQTMRQLDVVVAFCRYVSSMYHDVGLRFVAAKS
jgi:hypothetical protein